MNDRELLEKAAKAVGITLEWDGPAEDWQPLYYEGKTYLNWNPLEDDGDAFRLAASLGLVVSTDPRSISAQTIPGVTPSAYASQGGGDHLTDIRRAIVRAAAELGEQS